MAKSSALPARPRWRDDDGGTWDVFSTLSELPAAAGHLGLLVRYPAVAALDGQETPALPTYEVWEQHPTVNLHALARHRLHARATAFRASEAFRRGGLLCWGVKIAAPRRRRSFALD